MTGQVTLSPLTADLIDPLRGVRVAEDQVMFSGQPSEVVDHPETGLDIHVILFDGRVVGMFRIDRGYHRSYPFAPSDGLGLRTFLIDEQMQGRGIGKACCLLLQNYLSDRYKGARTVFLTVNLGNPAARQVYLTGGFIDTGDQWPHGEAGPQHILKLKLRP